MPEAADAVSAFVEADVPVAAARHGAQLPVIADAVDGHEIAGHWSLEVDVENAGAEFVDGVAVDEPFVTARVPDDLLAFTNATFEQAQPPARRDADDFFIARRTAVQPRASIPPPSGGRSGPATAGSGR